MKGKLIAGRNQETTVRTLTPHSSEFKVWNLYFQSCVLRYTINAPPLLKNTKYLKNVLKPNDNTYHCIKMYPVGPPGISRVHGTRLYCASTIDHDDITATFSSNPFIKTVEWEMLDKRWKQYLQYRVKGATYIWCYTYIVGCRGALQLGGLFQGGPPRV